MTDYPEFISPSIGQIPVNTSYYGIENDDIVNLMLVRNRQMILGHTQIPAANYFGLISSIIKRGNYAISALNNLRKKNEYLQLTIQFKEELITEKEYEEELELNENKYLIKNGNYIFGCTKTP